MVIEAKHSRRLSMILRIGSSNFQSFQVFGCSLSLRRLLSLFIFVELLLQILNLDGHLAIFLVQRINIVLQLLDLLILDTQLLIESIGDINDVIVLSVKGIELEVHVSDDPGQVVESLLFLDVGLLELVDLVLKLLLFKLCGLELLLQVLQIELLVLEFGDIGRWILQVLQS